MHRFLGQQGQHGRTHRPRLPARTPALLPLPRAAEPGAAAVAAGKAAEPGEPEAAGRWWRTGRGWWWRRAEPAPARGHLRAEALPILRCTRHFRPVVVNVMPAEQVRGSRVSLHVDHSFALSPILARYIAASSPATGYRALYGVVRLLYGSTGLSAATTKSNPQGVSP